MRRRAPPVLSALSAWLALAALSMAAPAQPDTRRSGADYMGESTRAMQRDDTLNPAMLWVATGEALWRASDAGARSCASCHGDARSGMRGVAARYPGFDGAGKLVLNLAQRINLCRQRHQHGAPWRADGEELLALESYVALQSRGMPVAPPPDAAVTAAAARGQALYGRRIGQLNLSCAQCHDQRAGLHLAGSPIPQAHAAAYPVYRLEWQAMGSLQRRLRNCIAGVRADVPPFGAAELVDLEAYLAARDRGMPLETPGVRP